MLQWVVVPENAIPFNNVEMMRMDVSLILTVNLDCHASCYLDNAKTSTSVQLAFVSAMQIAPTLLAPLIVNAMKATRTGLQEPDVLTLMNVRLSRVHVGSGPPVKTHLAVTLALAQMVSICCNVYRGHFQWVFLKVMRGMLQ